MNVRECEREAEIRGVSQAFWPELADATLRAHVAECEVCAEAAAIACAIVAAREEERTHSEIPEAGRIWWRAQLRARREAAKSAGRPITAAQVIAFACAAGLLGACFGATSTWFQSLLGELTPSVGELKWTPLVASVTGMLTDNGVWVLAGGAILLLIPAAVYLAVLRD